LTQKAQLLISARLLQELIEDSFFRKANALEHQEPQYNMKLLIEKKQLLRAPENTAFLLSPGMCEIVPRLPQSSLKLDRGRLAFR
jgi:hypothetical protein